MSDSLSKQIKLGGVKGPYPTWHHIPKGFPYVTMEDWRVEWRAEQAKLKKESELEKI